MTEPRVTTIVKLITVGLLIASGVGAAAVGFLAIEGVVIYLETGDVPSVIWGIAVWRAGAVAAALGIIGSILNWRFPVVVRE